MEKRKNNILFFFVILFIVGTIGLLLHSYFILPQSLIVAAQIDVKLFADVQLALLPSMIFVFVEFSFAIGLVTWLFIERQKDVTKEIVYIEKFVERNTQNKKENNQKGTGITEKISLLEQELSNTDSEEIFQLAINRLCNVTEAVAGAFFISKKEDTFRYVELLAAYAYQIPDSKTLRFEYGEGLVGQIAKEGKTIQISSVPEGYIRILSGLGQATPSFLLLIPIKNKKDKLAAVIEMAAFKEFSQEEIVLIEKIGKYIFSIKENT